MFVCFFYTGIGIFFFLMMMVKIGKIYLLLMSKILFGKICLGWSWDRVEFIQSVSILTVRMDGWMDGWAEKWQS